MGEKTLVAHRIGDFDAALLRDDADLGVFDRVATVFDDGRKWRNLVGIDDDGAEVSLSLIRDLRAARAARSERGGTHREERDGERGGPKHLLHGFLLLTSNGKEFFR